MKFLHPAFLFALLAIAIPIIIHLFSFRRYKTIYFSHVGFLKDIKKESQKKSKLKQLLMLLARILTIIFLVFAFSQPYIPNENDTLSESGQIVGVYIDNSFSMNALSEQGQLIERARNQAAEIALAYPTGTQFRLLTNDMEPQHQHLLNREQFIREVADVHTSPSAVALSFVHNRVEMQNQNQNKQMGLYYLSDFQRNITDFANFSGETVTSYFMPFIPNQVNNLYIDSCWVEVPAHALNQEENIFVRIKNSSNEAYQNLPLKLYLNDSLKSMTNFSVGAQNEIIANLRYTNLTSGIQLGRIEITDYPFTHDNSWYLSYFVEPKLKALAIYNNNPASKQGLAYISALFENDDYVELETMDIQSLQISKFAESNTIFLINPEDFSTGFLNELSSAVKSGTSVVLFPQTDESAVVNNQFLSAFGANLITGIDTVSQEIEGIDFDNRFYENVFKEIKENAQLPEISEHLKFSENVRTSETNLLWFQNGDKALSVLPFGKGKVWVFSFPLNEENEAFARDIIFVPSIYNIVMTSLPDQQISYVIGNDQSYLLPRTVSASVDASFEVEKRETGENFIPDVIISEQGIRLSLEGYIETAGHYLVKSEEETLAALSFNYNRQESDLRYMNLDEIRSGIEQANLEKASLIGSDPENLSKELQEIQEGKQLWKWCIVLALMFILAEVLIARFMKQ